MGRGGQALLVWISFKVYTRALLRVSEQTAIRYATYQAITLKNCSTSGTVQLFKDCFKSNPRRVTMILAWMTVSTMYTLAFPTLVSAMSGYSAVVEPFVSVGGDFVHFSEFRLVRYIIHDSWRLGDEFPGLVLIDTAAGMLHCSTRTSCLDGLTEYCSR